MHGNFARIVVFWRRCGACGAILSLTVLLLILGQYSALEAQPRAEEKNAPPAEASSSRAGLKGLLGNKNTPDAPLFVKSDSLNLDSKQRIFTYQGNVEIVRADLRITCDTMIGTYDKSNKLQTILCQNNVVITSGEEMRAVGNRAKYHVPSSIIELTEGPELARGENVLSADKIRIFVEEDRSDAEGNVRVKVVETQGLGPGQASPGTFIKGGSEDSAIDDSKPLVIPELADPQ